MIMQPALFITLEGVDGAGKSTLMDFIAMLFANAGREVVKTREPGGTQTGEQIRAMLLDRDNINLRHNTELLLLFAARMQHIEEVIKPALALGKVVLCDRFTDASYAYQGGGRGLAPTRVQTLETWVQQGLQPDLTLLFDLEVKVALQRTGAGLFSEVEADRFEQEKIDFFERIRACYLERAENEPERFRMIDATQAVADVQQNVQKIVRDYLC